MTIRTYLLYLLLSLPIPGFCNNVDAVISEIKGVSITIHSLTLGTPEPYGMNVQHLHISYVHNGYNLPSYDVTLPEGSAPNNCNQSYINSILPIVLPYSQLYSLNVDKLEIECGTSHWVNYGVIPDVDPPAPAQCSLSMEPTTLNWTMGPNGVGPAQASTLHVLCDSDASFETSVNGAVSKTGQICDGADNGVCANWWWNGKPPSAANPNSEGALNFTPVTTGASPGTHNTAVVVNINYN